MSCGSVQGTKIWAYKKDAIGVQNPICPPFTAAINVAKYDTVRCARYGFLLVCYSNCVPKFLRYSTFNYTVTWKLGLRSLKVIGIDTYQYAAYDLLLTFHSYQGLISYRFRDKR